MVPARTRFALAALIGLVVAWSVSCGGNARRAEVPGSSDGRAAAREGGPVEAPEDDPCPAEVPWSGGLAGIEAPHLDVATWLGRWAAQGLDLDRPLLDAGEVAAHNAALLANRRLEQMTLDTPADPADLARRLEERLGAVAGRIEDGTYRAPDGGRAPVDLAALAPRPPEARIDRVLRLGRDVQVRCAPTSAVLVTESLDTRFDRNLCSRVRVGEVLDVVGRWAPGWMLVRTRYTLGFVPEDELQGAGAEVSRAEASREEATSRESAPPLTRRAWLETWFARLDAPYGWGGAAGGRDCSRHVLDAFAAFGIDVPRNSALQARAGTWSVEVPAEADRDEVFRVADEAMRSGVVLVHFPGHIMAYLGRDEAGTPMAIHSFADHLVACVRPDGTTRDVLHRVDRMTVSGFGLGAGTARRSFAERITRLTVIGGPPGAGVPPPIVRAPAPGLAGACVGRSEHRLFVSPHAPRAGEAVRVVLTGPGADRPVGLFVEGASPAPAVESSVLVSEVPFARMFTFAAPAVGSWTLRAADGPVTWACGVLRVGGDREPPREAAWEPETERLWSAFVARLFTAGATMDTTWPELGALLRDPQANLLHNHLGRGEDDRLALAPDCADLPYVLRAYFAWKLGLPFGFRPCDRGRADRAPRCGAPDVVGAWDRGPDGVRAFLRVVNGRVRDVVHSGSGRTAAMDESTDFHPIPLTRESIVPGTVYMDPYGHVMMVTGWSRQGWGESGLLHAADAQPDATIGRRRFWRGTFLYDPAAPGHGAGFKAFRPIRGSGAGATPLANRAVPGKFGVAAFDPSGGALDRGTFFDTMDALVSPRAPDPLQAQRTLVTALEETIVRRVSSVDNGTRYVAENPAVIAMPEGKAIFLTVGPWEDYSTPSRDLRMLIAIDATLDWSRAVRANPGRWGVSGDAVDALVARVEAERDAALAGRTFTYTRSDGSPWTLSLADVVRRSRTFEVTWNPNDCPEFRWGAEPGTEEYATCVRRAPPDQQRRMEAVRVWFAERRRPG